MLQTRTIGFIGNFIPPHSTENERKWSFERLGHTVIPFQENRTTKEQLLSCINDLDMLVYSHTHDPDYVIDGLIDVFAAYKERGVPTVSAHLDRWLWLDRVKDVGKEATWFTEHIFMADCSPEAVKLYNELGLNWHYLKPGVVEKDCYRAEPNRQKYPHDIIFVGSKGYHPEYRYREELIDFLQNTYGDRFGLYGGNNPVRGEELNVLYASCKIAVGDSCFGGRPNYVSDRYYETRGRGGFLIHPRVSGVDRFGVAFYQHPLLQDLKQVIDFYLENDEEREKMRDIGYKWVKNHETYTERAIEILETVFGEDK
jgi:hypothetical protein